MISVRTAAVAGQFYPAVPETLAAEVAAYVDAAPPRSGGPRPKGVIAPHAGYMYSGPTAGHAFAALAPLAGTVDRIVVIGPSHRVSISGLALPGVDEFETPLGRLRVDAASCRALAELPQVSVEKAAHRWEHSLEVELPFVQALFPRATLCPLVVGEASATEVGQALELVWGGPETLVIVSTDLSHYLDYETARELDRSTAERLISGSGPLSDAQACGARAVNGLLELVPRRGLEIELLDLRSSGDTAGDRDRVVGYGAFAFCERP